MQTFNRYMTFIPKQVHFNLLVRFGFFSFFSLFQSVLFICTGLVIIIFGRLIPLFVDVFCTFLKNFIRVKVLTFKWLLYHGKSTADKIKRFRLFYSQTYNQFTNWYWKLLLKATCPHAFIHFQFSIFLLFIFFLHQFLQIANNITIFFFLLIIIYYFSSFFFAFILFILHYSPSFSQ